MTDTRDALDVTVYHPVHEALAKALGGRVILTVAAGHRPAHDVVYTVGELVHDAVHEAVDP